MKKTLQNLRLAPTDVLKTYVERRLRPTAFDVAGEAVLYHSWEPGFIGLTGSQAQALALLLQASQWPASFPAGLRFLLHDLVERGWCEDAAPDLDKLVLRTRRDFPAIQNPVELHRFLEEVQARRPRLIVEIGTASGGTFYCLSQVAPEDATLISIDLPDGPYGRGPGDLERQLFRTFKRPRQQLHFIADRSFHYSTREDLRALLGGRLIDLLFIDGDHSYGGVKSDFSMYSELVSPGGVVALHDIKLYPETWGRGFDVGYFWDELRARGEAVIEFVDPVGHVGWNSHDGQSLPAFGIGLVKCPLHHPPTRTPS